MNQPPTPEKRVETPRHDHLLYDEACNFDVPWSEEYQKLEQELQREQQNYGDCAIECDELKQQLQQAREELARLQEAIKLAGASQIFKREEELQSQLSQSQQIVLDMREALRLLTEKQHAGDCVFTDKSDEGCYLCREAAKQTWPTVEKALSITTPLANNFIKREEFEKVVEALRLLHDYQNGCPLPKYEKYWNQAMRDAEEILPHAETILKSQRGHESFTAQHPAQNQSSVPPSEQCPAFATPSGTPDTSPSVPQSPSDTPCVDRV